MPSFSKQSQDHLDTADWKLQQLFYHVIQHYDCTVIEGYRSKERQEKLYQAKKSKVQYSKHNLSPSRAVDVAPYIQGRGIPWPKEDTYIKDLAQFYHFAGYVEAVANELGYKIRWGGDWDRDHTFADQKFDDLVHFELRGDGDARVANRGI